MRVLCHARQLGLVIPIFQWIQPPDIIIGGDNSTVRFGRDLRWEKTDATVHLVGSCRPGRQHVVKRVPSQSRSPHRVSTFESPRGRATNPDLIVFQSHQPKLLRCETRECKCAGESWYLLDHMCANACVDFLSYQRHPGWQRVDL